MVENYNEYLNTADSDWFKFRVNRAAFAVLAVFSVLFARLIYLQLLEGENLRRVSESNSIRLQSIDPYRGLIFDRNGELLVDNRPSFDLSIVLKDARPLKQTVETLADCLNVSESELMATIKEKRRAPFKPVVLLKDIDRNMLASVEVRRFELPGVQVEVKPRRHYLKAGSSAHLIGYLGEVSTADLKNESGYDYRGGDSIGKFGVEKAYEPQLRGDRGGRQVEVDATGRVVRVLDTVSSRPGASLHLTLDHRLQEAAESMMDGRAGAIVAVIPDTGEILAMVSSPSFDQNFFVDGMTLRQWQELISNPLRPLENKAIQGEYPPGSTYKIITAMAGLEEGIIDENTTFYCPGHFRLGDRVFHCWKRGGHGKVSLNKALTESCDVYFYNVGKELGVDRLAWYARASGLGTPTGIDLDHEEAGLIPSAAWKHRRFGVPWQKGETLSIAIGQGFNLATPLQMAMLIAAVANNGKRYVPLILKTVHDAETGVTRSIQPRKAGQLPASRKTLELLQQGLFNAVNTRRGTGWGIHEGIPISGKTGSAEVISRKKGEKNDEKNRAFKHMPHAWFVGYGPSESPEIAVAAIVEHGEHGGSAAAPIVGKLIRLYLENQKVSEDMNVVKIAGQ